MSMMGFYMGRQRYGDGCASAADMATLSKARWITHTAAAATIMAQLWNGVDGLHFDIDAAGAVSIYDDYDAVTADVTSLTGSRFTDSLTILIQELIATA